MKQSMVSIAENLKRLRENHNLSFDQLAERTGVSKSMLRQIETGGSSPTIATIWKIANGLKVSFTSLLQQPHVEAVVRPFKHSSPLTGENEEYRLFPLVPFDPERAFETYYVEIDPGTAFSGEPHEGNVNEYIYVMRGKLRVSVKEEEFEINEQEFFQFHANCPHEYKCISRKTASAIMQISYL